MRPEVGSEEVLWVKNEHEKIGLAVTQEMSLSRADSRSLDRISDGIVVIGPTHSAKAKCKKDEQIIARLDANFDMVAHACTPKLDVSSIFASDKGTVVLTKTGDLVCINLQGKMIERYNQITIEVAERVGNVIRYSGMDKNGQIHAGSVDMDELFADKSSNISALSSFLDWKVGDILRIIATMSGYTI